LGGVLLYLLFVGLFFFWGWGVVVEGELGKVGVCLGGGGGGAKNI